jgi:hypothetical protein
MKRIILFVVSIYSAFAVAEIPGWYKRDIVKHLEEANAVILYRVKNVQFQSTEGPYFSYRIETETLQTLKGNPPIGACYFIHTEGAWEHPYKIGEDKMVILNVKYTGECGVIESGFAAPATEEYVSLFKSIIG